MHAYVYIMYIDMSYTLYYLIVIIMLCIVILLYSTYIVLVCTFFVTIILILYTFSLKYVCLNEVSLYIINVVSVFIHKNDNKATYMPQ